MAREHWLAEIKRRNERIAAKEALSVGKKEDFLFRLEDLIKHQKVVLPKSKPAPKKGITSRILNVMLSDLHYGADLDGDEVPNQYRSTEERRRTAAVVREVLAYKPHYRSQTELYVHLAGDIIQGRLHDLRTGAPMAEQFARALWVLSTAIARLAEAFPRGVTVFCTPGNHGRIKDRHEQRATDQKWDSYENMLYEAIRMRFHGDRRYNVRVVIPKTPYYEYEAFGLKGFVTHGDTVINPGFPGKAINVQKLEQQVLRLISAKGRYDLVAVGHVHTSSATQLPNGTMMLTNGCLIPPDPYAVSIGIHSTACSQQLWESVPGYLFGDHRILNINPDHDKDATLDSIIPPDPGGTK